MRARRENCVARSRSISIEEQPDLIRAGGSDTRQKLTAVRRLWWRAQPHREQCRLVRTTRQASPVDNKRFRSGGA